jgi:hypothetical protein
MHHYFHKKVSKSYKITHCFYAVPSLSTPNPPNLPFFYPLREKKRPPFHSFVFFFRSSHFCGLWVHCGFSSGVYLSTPRLSFDSRDILPSPPHYLSIHSFSFFYACVLAPAARSPIYQRRMEEVVNLHIFAA